MYWKNIHQVCLSRLTSAIMTKVQEGKIKIKADQMPNFMYKQETSYAMEQPLVLSHLILSTMPLLSYQMNYPTLQFDCYGTALSY